MFKDFREICVRNNLLNFEFNFFIISRRAIKPCIIAAPYQGALNLAKRSLYTRVLKWWRYPVPTMVPPRKATPSPTCPFAQLTTVMVAPMAVRIATMSWMMYLMVSFFIVLKLKVSSF